MDYEGIIEDIGGFGYWQRVIFGLISLPDIPIALALLLPVFVGSVPNWTCNREAVNQTDSSINLTDGKNVTMSYFLNGNASGCDGCHAYYFNDTFTTIVSEWDLVCSRDYITDLITTFQLLGLALGAAFFSQISDMFGRKKAHFFAILLVAVSGLISAFSTSWQMFASLRLVVGISLGGYFSVNCVYPLEFISRGWRTLCGSIGFWPLGQMFLALLAYLIRDWRYLTATTACFAFLYLLCWWLLPESPRWLLQRGRTAEAKDIFTKIATKNRKPVPNMDFLDSICSEKETISRQSYTYMDLFRNKVILRRSIISSISWFIILLTYYELSFNVKNLSGDRYLNIVYGALFDLVGLIVVISFNNAIGRRRCTVIAFGCQVLVNVSIVTFYLLNKEVEYESTVTWFALVGKGIGGTLAYLVQIHVAELFPTDVRNLGVGAAACFGRVGGLLAPQVIYLGTKIKVFPFALISSLCAVAIPLCLLLPETSGQPLVDDFNFKKQTPDKKQSRIKESKI